MNWPNISDILALLSWQNLLLVACWTGPVVWLVLLVLLIRSKWNREQPLAKWGVLSLLAHNLLFAYATTVRIASGGASHSSSPTVMVSIVDALDDADDARNSDSRPQPWQTFPTSATVDPPVASLARPELAPQNEPVRERPSDSLELPLPDALANLPAPPSASPGSEALSDDAGTVRTASSEEPASIESPKPQSRDVEAPTGPDVASPEPLARQGDDASTAKRSTSTSPGELLANSGLPPRLADVPTTSDPTEALADVHDLATGGRAAATQPAQLESADAKDTTGGTQPETAASAASAGGNGGAIEANASAATRPSAHPPLPALYEGRVSSERDKLLRREGGGDDTEAAVASALKWLAANQNADGRWRASQHGAGGEGRVDGQDRRGAGGRADTGITGLALLAFLGAGHTHVQGDYQDTVRRGLEYLLRAQNRDDGNLGGQADVYAFMYCHAMAAFAVSEAYAMTGDERLRPSVQWAVYYTVQAQNPRDGGWRYRPGDAGDASQLGWQLMSLKSAQLAGVEVPRQTLTGAERFLRSVAAGDHLGLARYQPQKPISRAMTAEAQFCRDVLGTATSQQTAGEATHYVLESPPGLGRPNLYYWYYATLALHQRKGAAWEQWNAALKKELLATQRTGGAAAGSWDIDTVWGAHGGRVYTTALAALCLEIYYRYQPFAGARP